MKDQERSMVSRETAVYLEERMDPSVQCMVNWSSPHVSATFVHGDYHWTNRRSFSMREKGGNSLVPGTDYMVGALKLPNQAPRDFGESLQTCVPWCCPDGTQHLLCWSILAISGQSLASNGSVIDSRDLNLVFGHTEANHNK
ncbi:hypothetical protein TNCV_4428621 [Trichonephila clavipes]|nr:hypothetical protein TNCV_4428621 [Trichonephila clavipes]